MRRAANLIKCHNSLHSFQTCDSFKIQKPFIEVKGSLPLGKNLQNQGKFMW